MSIKKTNHFQNCLGVFQGGGCKAIAFAGAYEEAVKRGVFFSEVAGTSAGAIVAVFVGAGATPAQLNKIIEEMNFRKFMSKPKPFLRTNSPRYKLALMRMIPHKKFRNYVRHFGLYNADYIADWVNKELAILLGIEGRPILFSDLPIPTSVVSTDLNTLSVKLWSKDHSPEQEVGKAVQTSCSIPFYFQPFENRYVDGGMVSNLPSYLMKPKSIFNKVLAFGFKRHSSFPDIKNGLDLFQRILFSAIDGGMDVQLTLQQNVSVIEIDTGGVEATDFDKITIAKKRILLQNGQKATSDFFESESVNVRKKNRNENLGFDVTESFNLLIKSSTYLRQEILISDDKGSWIYSLFGLLIKWKKENSLVKILLKKASETEEHRKYKIRLLENLGFVVKEVDVLPFKGFLFDGESSNGCAVIFNESRGSELNFESKYYSGHEDYLFIKRLKDEFDFVVKDYETKPESKLNVQEIQETQIIQKLKNVQQYKNPNVEIKFEEVDIENIIFLTEYLKGYKYRLVENLFNLYKDNDIEFCKPAALIFEHGKELIITPPVIEKHGEKFYVIEGNARIVYASRNGYHKIGAMVVKNVTDSMPSSGEHRLKSVLVSDINKEGKGRYEEYNYQSYRKIEENIRNPKTSLLV